MNKDRKYLGIIGIIFMVLGLFLPICTSYSSFFFDGVLSFVYRKVNPVVIFTIISNILIVANIKNVVNKFSTKISLIPTSSLFFALLILIYYKIRLGDYLDFGYGFICEIIGVVFMILYAFLHTEKSNTKDE